MSSLIESNELFINIKNPPLYDSMKHFFEQEKSTIEFYLEEERKMRQGVTVGGVFIPPWLYYHINFFKTSIPQEDGSEPIINPPLRDNEWYFAENLITAEKERKGLALFGSRRFSKSTIESSFIGWTNLMKENGETVVVGGDEKDLNNLSKNLKESFNNIHPAFHLPRIRNDWNKLVTFGLKDKSGEELIYSQINIINANEGKSKSSEKGAGMSPVGFVIDEFGKFPFLEFFEGAMPSFNTEYGWKATPLLAGTGGNKELSQDAMRLLNNPEAWKIIPMNWDTLENKIEDKDMITWKRKSFGTFIPSQMSYMDGNMKIKSNLADYLKIDDKELKEVKINVTDWKLAKDIMVSERLAKGNDKKSLNKLKMYHPFDPDECFLNRIDNPFNAKAAQSHRSKLIEEGNTGTNVDLRVTNGKYESEFSDKERAEYPFQGGIHNAPVVLYGTTLPEFIPPYGKFVGGLDPYKQAKATTDSVGVCYILQRNVDIAYPCEKIVASYASRPDTIDIFNRTCEMLSEAFKAEILMENADQSFIQYLSGRNKAEIILAEGVDLSQSLNPNSKPSTRFGLYPTERNKDYLIKLVISYCNTLHELGVDDEGNLITKYGVEYIDDIDLLQEIINYKPGANVDRIVAFGHALAWARRMDSLNIIPDSMTEAERQKKRVGRLPVNRRGNKYSANSRRGKGHR